MICAEQLPLCQIIVTNQNTWQMSILTWNVEPASVSGFRVAESGFDHSIITHIFSGRRGYAKPPSRPVMSIQWSCALHSYWKYIRCLSNMPLSLDGSLCLRPGGAGPNKNPFAGFGKGAGASLPKKVSSGSFQGVSTGATKLGTDRLVNVVPCILCCHQLASSVQTQEAGPLREERKKAPGDIIKYTDDFLLKFREVHTYPCTLNNSALVLPSCVV